MALPSEIWDLKAIKPRAVDVRGLRLAPDEGYILSRIDGPLSLRELSAISGLGEEQVAEIVGRLVAHGVIDGPPGLTPAPSVTRPPPPPPRAPSTAAPRLGGTPGASTGRISVLPPPGARPSTRVPAVDPGAANRPSTPSPGSGPPYRPASSSVRVAAAASPSSVRVPAAPPAPAAPAAHPAPTTQATAPPAAEHSPLIAAPDFPYTPPPIGQLGSIELAVWGMTDVGRARSNNEDAFAIFDLTDASELSHGSFSDVGPKGILLTVADGMGGENAGEVASAITVAAMREYVQAGLHDDIGESLAASVVHANGKVIEAAAAPERAGMGAAVVSVLLCDGVAHVTEVGDCRAYLFRDGTLTQLTKDQTHVQILIDQGLMTPEAAKKSRAKSVVLQAVGKTEDLSVTQRELTLRNGDRLLLCSDGLTVNVTDAEIGAKLAGALEGAVESLIALANERGGVDNVTVVIVEATGALPPSHPEDRVHETLRTIREFEIGGGGSDDDQD